VNDSFQPAWLRVAVVLAVVAGVVAAVWLFANLASGQA
jgi:hypothetical protein